MKNRLVTLFSLILFALNLNAQDYWKFVKDTNIRGSINGTITKGYVFKTSSREYFVVNERVRVRVRIRNPEVTIHRNGSNYRLIIEEFDEPIICKKLNSVIETQIDGEFEGWEGETIFKLMNGEIWQQSSYAYMYHYAYSPEVLIYEFNGSNIMKVEEVDETIMVRKIVLTKSSSTNESVIESKIDGEFNGWTGETIFKLTNGQIWQQSSYAYMYHYAYSPSVMIYMTSTGYVMKVEDVEETINVYKLK